MFGDQRGDISKCTSWGDGDTKDILCKIFTQRRVWGFDEVYGLYLLCVAPKLTI